MAKKLIAVTLANIQNTGKIGISPQGIIRCQIVRAIDDEQVFQSEILYNSDQGTIRIPPGESRSLNVMKQLTVSHFGLDEGGGLNQMLLIFSELSQNFVVIGSLETRPYFGDRKKVRFDEITGFDTVTVLQNTAGAETARFTATYTISLLQEDRSDERSKAKTYTT
jgi:hypothetical protein